MLKVMAEYSGEEYLRLSKLYTNRDTVNSVSIDDVGPSNFSTADPSTRMQRLLKAVNEEQAQFQREQRIARERATKQESKDASLIE
ncbi:hypothetical protein Tco_0798449 [Tanacetum coccineum]